MIYLARSIQSDYLFGTILKRCLPFSGLDP
jgi:hypothetical protein